MCVRVCLPRACAWTIQAAMQLPPQALDPVSSSVHLPAGELGKCFPSVVPQFPRHLIHGAVVIIT